MDITELRKEIDGIDQQMVPLFRRRMELSKEVAGYKKEHDLPVWQKNREREILAHVAELAGEEMEGYTRILYSTIFDLSKSYQISLTAETTRLIEEIKAAAENTPKLFPKKGVVAVQGVEGAYSQIACDRLFSRCV